jgi:hypothetical protein
MGMAAVLILATLAQTAAAGTNAQDRARAQTLLGEGATLYEHGDYMGALDRFNAAYAAYPSSKIWFNIGQAYRVLGRPVEARDAYRHFLDEVPNASRENREDAQASLEGLQKWLGQLTVSCESAGAQITIDGKTVGQAPLPGPVWVTPGRHQVTAVRAGDCPIVENAEVPTGARLTVALIPLHGSLAARPAGVDLGERAKQQGRDQGWMLGRKWTWVAAGATVVLTGAAAIVGWSMQSRFDELRGSCGRGSATPVGCSQSDIDSLHTRKVTANVLWGAAGAAALTTGVLFFVEGRPVTVAPVAGETTGMLARVRF